MSHVLSRPSLASAAHLILCVLALSASMAGAAQSPERIPETPEQQIFNLYQRVTALEQQVATLRERLARAEAGDVKRERQIGDLTGRVVALERKDDRDTSLPTEAPRERATGTMAMAPFVILNEDGQPILEVRSGSAPALTLFGGNPHAKLVTVDDRGVSYFNKAGKAIGRLGIGEGQAGELLLGTQAGDVSASLFASSEGAGLHLRFGNGTPMANLNRHGLAFYDAKAGATAVIGLQKDGSGMLQLSNAAGKPSVEAGADPDGVGWVHAGPLYRCMAMAGPTVMAGGVPDCLRGKLK